MEIPNLKVLTLNCWGLRYLSKDVSYRYKELCKALLKFKYDLVALQEVWSHDDFNKLKQTLKPIYTHSHYYYSGCVGSGLAIFSRYYIVDVLQYRFTLNGPPHHIHNGDWLGGKSIGLAKVKYNDCMINVYMTHLHANYSPIVKNDSYLAHRISQAYELSQFILHTSESADVTLLMGDLNLEPHELGFKIIKENAGLQDAFKESLDAYIGDPIGATCHTPNNFYSNKKDQKSYPNGIRIDYILYKNSKGINVNCINCEPCLGKIPQSNLNYSDHEALQAEFEIKQVEQQKLIDKYPNDLYNLRKENLLHALEIIDMKFKSIFKYQIASLLIGVLSFILLFLLNNYTIEISTIKNVLSSFTLIFCLWYCLFHKRIESNNLKSIKSSMEIALNLY